jgi:hypothetical protein
MTICLYNRLTHLKILSGIIPAEIKWDADWLLFILMIPMILYAIVIFYEKFPAARLTRVVYINRYASNAFRNRTQGSQLGSALLLINSALGLSTYMFFLEVSYNLYFFSLSGIGLWFFNLALIVVSAGLRLIIIYLIGSLTRTLDAFNEYAFNILQFYKLLGIPLLVFNFFIPYFESVPDIILFVITAIFIASLLVFRPLRLASVFITKGFSLLYFILYLCALEFIPVLVFVKYLAGTV